MIRGNPIFQYFHSSIFSHTDIFICYCFHMHSCYCHLASGTQSLKNFGETNSIEGMHTSESEDDKRMHTPEKTKSSASITLSSPLSNSASDDNRWKFELARRRAERDSWRKRHEEEKERLRIRIEKNRQDIQRQLQEKEAEFNRMQEELEREQRSLKELQQEKLAAGDYTGTDVPLSYKSYMEEFGSSPTWDHVLYNHRKQLHSVTTAQNTSSPMEEIKVSVSISSLSCNRFSTNLPVRIRSWGLTQIPANQMFPARIFHLLFHHQPNGVKLLRILCCTKAPEAWDSVYWTSWYVRLCLYFCCSLQ